MAHLEKGLALLKTLPATSARARQEIDLQILLGGALGRTKGFAATEVEGAYLRARALCEQVDDVPKLGAVLRALSPFYLLTGQLQTALELGEQLLRLAELDIEVHVQLVVVPGLNDGRHLDRSIEDLADLYPAVRSVSAVPVGLTKYHRGG